MECLVQSGVVPFVLFVVKAFCDIINVSVGILAVANLSSYPSACHTWIQCPQESSGEL